jgi:hypothetical protein
LHKNRRPFLFDMDLRLLYQLGSGFFFVPSSCYRVATYAVNSGDRSRRFFLLPIF